MAGVTMAQQERPLETAQRSAEHRMDTLERIVAELLPSIP